MPVVWFGAGLDLVHGSPLPLVRHAPHGSLFLIFDLFWIESATKTQNTPTKWTWDPGMLTVSQLAEPKKIQALYWDILRYTEAIEEIRYGSGDVVQPGLRWGMGPRCGEIWHLYGTYMVLIWCLLSAWTFAWWQFLRKLIGTKKMFQTMVDGMGDRGDPIFGSKPFRKQTASLDFDYGWRCATVFCESRTSGFSGKSIFGDI